MEQLELTEEQRRIYQAIAAVEAERGPGTLHEIAVRGGLPVERTREVLSALTGDKDLVRELGTTQPDVGARYSVKGQPFPS
ncbi:MAG TPA: hypothetical protein VG452_13220 [Egibacteraceae bacterium]|nr:hypothetical protein [Actinomycetota bacterium]HWB73170.1 hypothetical protein [Egibacteraceae bacterium]